MVGGRRDTDEWNMKSVSSTLDLRAFSYEDRQGLLPSLVTAFTRSGGWVLDRKTTSASTMQFRLEIQLHAIVELYAALVGTGLEFTRDAHAALAELCTCRRYIALSPRSSQVVTLSLELSFLEDVTLHSLLSTGAAAA